MRKLANKPSPPIRVTVDAWSDNFIISFTRELDTPISEILEKLRRGDQTALSQFFYTMFSGSLKSGSVIALANLQEQSIETLSSGFKYTLSDSQLSRISYLLRTLGKNLEFLKQTLTRTAASEPHTISQALPQVDSLVVLMISGLAEISRTLKSDSDESSSQTQA